MKRKVAKKKEKRKEKKTDIYTLYLIENFRHGPTYRSLTLFTPLKQKSNLPVQQQQYYNNNPFFLLL